MNRAITIVAILTLGAVACDSKTRSIAPTAQVDDCGRCHGYPPPAFIAGGTSHTASTECSLCHPGTVEADNVTIVPGGLHMNGVVDVAAGAGHGMPFLADHSAAALADIVSCRACHGADYGGGVVNTSCNGCHATDVAGSGPDWKANCTFCHGTRTAGVTTATAQAAPPRSVVVTADQTRANPKIGAHQAHLTQGSIANAVPCASCHAVPAVGDQTQAPVHFSGNGAQGAISFSAFATKGVTGAAYTGGTCNVYCHGAGTEFSNPAGMSSPAWTSTGVTCTTCHGAPPSSHSANSTDCSTCHPGTVNPDGTINLAGGLHINGVKDVTSAHASDWALPTQHGYSANATGLSSCKTCHGADLTGGSGPSCASCHAATVASWDTSCTFCHGDRSTGRASPPVDTQGRSVTSNVSVGAHASHVGTTITTPLACSECHPARSSSVITDAAHIDGDGVAEVVFGTLARTGGANATYTRASATSATCSSVYCHGQFTGGTGWDPSWTSTTQASCASCHAFPPTSGHHGTHSNYGCSECHGHTGSGPTHVNGRKDVPFSSSVTSPVPPPVFNGSCTLTCHNHSHSNDTW